MSKFFHFSVNKLYFKQSFNNVDRNRGPLFPQINFDHTYFWGFCAAVFSGGLCPRVYALELMSSQPSNKLFGL